MEKEGQGKKILTEIDGNINGGMLCMLFHVMKVTSYIYKNMKPQTLSQEGSLSELVTQGVE